MNDLENKSISTDLISKYLVNYYKDKNTAIIGLNDSQGVDTGLLFRKGVLELVRDMLVSSKNDLDTFNAFSLMFNKTEHIDYFLDCNLTLEDIKNLQVEGAVSALTKFFHTDLKIPKVVGDLGKIGYISNLFYKKNKEDGKFALTDTIINSTEPIVIYSCGANDLMREGWCSPFSINGAYKNRYNNRIYFYAKEKFEDPNTVKKVVSRVEHNFDHILSLNDKANILALGLYIPASMQKEGMEIFNDAIKEYNLQLQELCDKYKNYIDYIDTYTYGSSLSKNAGNFHASYSIQQLLANQVIEKLYKKKVNGSSANYTPSQTYSVENSGLAGLNKNLTNDLYLVSNQKADKLSLLKKYKEKRNISSDEFLNLDREIEICSKKMDELERQISVTNKSLQKKKTL